MDLQNHIKIPSLLYSTDLSRCHLILQIYPHQNTSLHSISYYTLLLFLLIIIYLLILIYYI